MTTAPLKTFIIYAHEDSAAVEQLRKQLAPLEKKATIELWYDGKILPGDKWDESIRHRLEQAELVLLCVSVDFINSAYIENTELEKALQRHREGLAHLAPIILRPCDWPEYFGIGQFQALPNKARPVYSSHFPHLDEAFYEVQQGIKSLAADLLEKRAARLHAELEAASRAEAEAAEEAAKERERAERDKAERARHRRDEAFWQVVQTDAQAAAADLAHQIALFESYLQDPEFRNHRAEAEEAIEDLQAALDAAERRRAAQEAARLKRETAERLRREAEAAETKRKAEEAAGRLRRETEAAEAKRKAEEAARKAGLPDMVLVKGGAFQMGEKGVAEPVHKVTLSDFAIGKYPVTQKLWKEMMGKNPSHFKDYDDCPVEQVSWNDVQDFLKKLNAKFPGKNYRLPTEAEWEYAARGGPEAPYYRYAGGDDIDSVAWYDGNSFLESMRRTHPVGEKKPVVFLNGAVLYDLTGNVWEWCWDWYAEDQYREDAGGVENPLGAKSGEARVCRGGSWYFDPENARAANRGRIYPLNSITNLGFRLARGY